MLYLKQDFNLHPASPATRDRFVELAQQQLLPSLERLGGRLVAAWLNHAEWYSQLTHVIEFQGFPDFETFRDKAREDSEWIESQREVEVLAPERADELLEPLGPVPPQTLDAAIKAASDKPEGTHTFAILEVAAGRMEQFTAMLGAAGDKLPIIAAWRPVAGNPNRVIDLWKGSLGQEGYEPTTGGMDAFFEPLRKIAPRERLVNLYPLPYSPLR